MRSDDRPRPLILDTGALIAAERDDRRVGLLFERARELRTRILIPAGVLAQAWRDGSRQVRLVRLLKADDVEVVNLTEARAKAAGELCGHRQTSDVVDASLVVLARQTGGFVATSDPSDLRQLDPRIVLAPV